MKKLSDFSAAIGSTGFFTAFLCLVINFPRFYTDVMAPSPYKQGFVKPMFLIGGAVAAITILFFFLLRKKLNMTSANKNIPILLFGCLLVLLTFSSPYGMSLTLGEKLHWLTPTITGNALTASYVLYVIAMGLAGGCSLFTTTKLAKAAQEGWPVAFTACVSLFMTGALTVLPRTMGYERVFLIVAAFCICMGAAAMVLDLIVKKRV